MNVTVSQMRAQMTLKTEESAMMRFRTTMRSAERFKRYLRMDNEGLSMLLAKVTLTTCYGIPRKGEVGYISEDENEDPPERTTKEKMGRWNEIDLVGMVEPKHHTDRGYQVPDETKSMPLDDPSTPTAISRDYDKSIGAIGRKTRESIDKDISVETDFFQQGKIPRQAVDDPAFGEASYDIFECLPDELEVTPDGLHEVRSPRVSAPAPATRVSPQASTRTTVPAPEAGETHPRVAPTRRTTASTQGDETREPQWRRQWHQAVNPPRERSSPGDGSQRPREPEMQPPRDPPQRRVTTREEARLPHTEGDIIRVYWPRSLRQRTAIAHADKD